MKFVALCFLILGACAKSNYADSGGDASDKNAACFVHSRECVSFTWEKMPTEVQAGDILLKFFLLNAADRTQVLADPQGKIALSLVMPGMAHGSSDITVVREDTGIFRASGLFFSMHGAWELHVQLKNGDVVSDEAIIPLHF